MLDGVIDAFMLGVALLSIALTMAAHANVEPPGPSSRRTPIVITEIMYRPWSPALSTNVSDLEFIEIFNSNPFFEDISGYRLSGAVDYTFPTNSVLQGGEYRVVARNPVRVASVYGIPNVMGPFVGGLPQSGTVRLRNKEGAVLLEIEYSNQPPWPAGADGTGHSLVLARPSYGENRFEAWSISDRPGGSPGSYDVPRDRPERSVVINEFLANSVEPEIDYVELYNHSNVEVDLSGCTLSDEPHTNKFILPPNTRIAPRGFLAFGQDELGFGLSSGGETIFFRSADDRGVLDAVRFGPQAVNVSSGRFPDGSAEIYPLTELSPFAPNSAILISDIVINEIMYNPISTQDDDEYVELYNRALHSVDVSGWRFVAGIDYQFPPGTVVAPDGYLVVARNVARMQTNYPNLNASNTRGNFSGNLRNKGERVALARPDLSVTTNSVGEVRTNTVYVVVDEVTYGVGGNWGRWANGGGSSLELIDPRSDHRLARNWTDSDETTKAPWTTIEFTGQFDLGAETPDNLQVTLLGEGECLLDNVEIFAAGGANLCSNGTFESGLAPWTARGTHLRSTLESVGDQSSKSLHVRASARGDTSINRLRVPLTGAAPRNGLGTIRARVRWLAGWPEIIVRTHGNWAECFGRMTLPPNLGTPGARNSRAIANAPPAIYDVQHAPVLPAANQTVIVTSRCSDPDGIAAFWLYYRIDPSLALVTVPMRDDGSGGDAVAGDGIFSASIPGQPANTLVAFQLEAVDLRGASRLFPLQDETYTQPFECLIRFGDPIPAGAFGTYRMWMTQGNLSDWQQRPSMSNERIFGTFVYGNDRVIYNMSVKWAGSPYHQYSVIASPELTEANYSIELPLDDTMLGTENFNKLHAPGNGPFEDPTCQREQIAYWTARQMGLPWGYRRFVNVYFNGVRRGGTNAIMEDAQTPGADMVEQFFPDDPDGNLYKMQLWFESADIVAGAVPFTPVAGCYLNRYTTVSNGVSMQKVARERPIFLARAIKGTANDYGPVLDLIDAANAPAATLTARLSDVADVEEWFRIFAVERATGNWDSFGSQSAQNMYGYVPEKGKFTLMIWDWNTVLGGTSGAWPPGQNLFFVNTNDLTMQALYRHPPFRRMYLRALKEVCQGPWAGNAIHDVLDAKYQALRASQIGVAEPGADGIKSYIATARSVILAAVASEDATSFHITVPDVITTSNNLIVITGEAPVEARSILINGVEYSATWTDVRTFRVQFPATLTTNRLSVQAADFYGASLPGFATNITVVLTRPVPDPAPFLVLNEIMYHPTNAEASYVEIYNNSDFSFDLTGWHVNGVGYTFPSVSVITNRQHLVLVHNPAAYVAAYPGAPIFDRFEGNLDLDGETLTLERPTMALTTNGAVVTTNIVFQTVDKVRYERSPPWPLLADGQGASLQLVDANRDNSRAGAWTDHEEWRRVTLTGIIAAGTTPATNFTILLSAPGETYVDDIVLVTGPRAESGPNLLLNGDFESSLSGPWAPVGNHAGSELSMEFSHSGAASLHVIASGAGSPANAVVQVMPAFTSNTICTLSYWFRPGPNSGNLGLRTTPGNSFSSSSVLRPVAYTPGAFNTGTASLPAEDSLWLNEIQTVNLSGLADAFGEREPWLEIYNSGTNNVALDGYSLVGHADADAASDGWNFPAGSVLAPGRFAIVWLDGQSSQSTPTEWHASFRPAMASGTVVLARTFQGRTRVVDYLTYSNQAPDVSYGDFPNGQPFTRQSFRRPTPGDPNDAREATVFINEWMAANAATVADPADGRFDDWFEIYNAGSETVDLGGYWLTDNLTAPRGFQIPNNGRYVVPARGFLLVWADNEPNQNTATNGDLHANFQLRAAGEAIGLFTPDGVTAIDTIVFTPQTNNLSQGRFPDGAANVFFMNVPTPRGKNVVGPLSPPRVSNVRVESGKFSIAFETTVGRTYQVEFKNALDDVAWIPLSAPVRASGPSLSMDDDVGHPQRFYRVIRID